MIDHMQNHVISDYQLHGNFTRWEVRRGYAESIDLEIFNHIHINQKRGSSEILNIPKFSIHPIYIYLYITSPSSSIHIRLTFSLNDYQTWTLFEMKFRNWNLVRIRMRQTLSLKNKFSFSIWLQYFTDTINTEPRLTSTHSTQIHKIQWIICCVNCECPSNFFTKSTLVVLN